MTVRHRNNAVKHCRPHAGFRLKPDVSPPKTEIASALCKAANIWFKDLDTEFSRKAAELVLNDHEGFLSHVKSFDHRNYEDVEIMRRDYQVASLLKKANFLSIKMTNEERKNLTIDKWVEAEKQCMRSNEALRELVYGSDPNPEWLATLSKARSFIARVLGTAPKVSSLKPRFGPGSTYLVKRQIVKPKKYTPTAVCTPNLVPYLHALRGQLWPTNEVIVVDGNSLGVVPKTAEIDRTIGVEPDMNVYMQLALGEEIRDRLRPWIDLDNGQDVNRRLASRAHIDRLSTIDLASASDTVCYMLVLLLLPEDWFDLLDACRSPCTIYQGKAIPLEKFSSMGNGYTFELETLIFYALARAAGSSEFWTTCYGDDLIVDRASYDAVTETLEFFGFKVNDEKSFKEGNFFESCGSDFFNGVNVRPVFWKNADKVVALYKAINDVSRWCGKQVTPLWGYRDAALGQNTYSYLRYKLQAHRLDVLIPDGVGDVGIISEFDEAVPRSRGAGLEGFTYKVVKYTHETSDWSYSESGYLCAMDSPSKANYCCTGGWEDEKDLDNYIDGLLDLSVSVTESGVSSLGSDAIPVRGRGRYVHAIGQHHCWSSLGPWL